MDLRPFSFLPFLFLMLNLELIILESIMLNGCLLASGLGTSGMKVEECLILLEALEPEVGHLVECRVDTSLLLPSSLLSLSSLFLSYADQSSLSVLCCYPFTMAL